MDRLICEACDIEFEVYYICLTDPITKTRISIRCDAFTRGWPGPDSFEDTSDNTIVPCFCFDCMSDILFEPFMLSEGDKEIDIEE